jgi:hypothetical protein
MTKVLPGTVHLTVLCLLLSFQCLASENISKNLRRNYSLLRAAAPIITAPANVSVNTDQYSSTASGVILGTPVTTGTGVSVTNNAPANYPIGTTSVLWTVTDSEGATASATQTVTVTDNEKPLVFAMGEIGVVNDPGTCGAVVNLNDFMPYTFDNSGTVYLTNDAPAVFPVGSVRVIWTATDMYGNSDTATQLITVIDNEVPVITISNKNFSVFSEPGKCSASVDLGTPVTSDNCGIVSLTNDAPASFPVGTTVVTWTVTDLNGYTVTATQSVTVTDLEKPLIQVPGGISVVNDAGKCGAAVNPGSALFSDNCGIASVTNNAPSFFVVGSTIVTWTVTDIHGNSDTATQMVTVIDNELPTISIGNITANTDAGKRVATVNLGTPVTNDNCGVVSVTNNAPSSFTVGTTNVAWTVTDKNGFTATAVQTVTVIDNETPSITAPANVTGNNSAGKCGTSFNIGTPITSDNCGVAGVTSDAPSFFPCGTTLVIWTVTDNSGNTSTASQTVVVKDVQAPVINAVANINVNTSTNVCGATVNFAATATDNCGATVITYSKNPGTVFPTGVTTVTVTAKDAGGNTATRNFTVTVSDNQKPAITAPANVTVTTGNSSVSGSSVNLGTPVTGDNCGVKTVTNNAPSNYLEGQTNVTWTVKDNSGNSSTTVQTVTVTRKKSHASVMSQGAGTPEAEDGLKIVVAPNPSTTYFTLKLESRYSAPVALRISDASGKIVESRNGLTPNSTVQMGHTYNSGTYFAEMIQGGRRKVVQLFKLK